MFWFIIRFIFSGRLCSAAGEPAVKHCMILTLVLCKVLFPTQCQTDYCCLGTAFYISQLPPCFALKTHICLDIKQGKLEQIRLFFIYILPGYKCTMWNKMRFAKKYRFFHINWLFMICKSYLPNDCCELFTVTYRLSIITLCLCSSKENLCWEK